MSSEPNCCCHSGHCFNIKTSSSQDRNSHYNTTPDSKVRGADMGPSGADRTQVGPMLAPWTLLSGYCLVTVLSSYWERRSLYWNWFCSWYVSLYYLLPGDYVSTYSAFFPGEPDTGETGCLVLERTGSFALNWWEDNCDAKKAFICQIGEFIHSFTRQVINQWSANDQPVRHSTS